MASAASREAGRRGRRNGQGETGAGAVSQGRADACARRLRARVSVNVRACRGARARKRARVCVRACRGMRASRACACARVARVAGRGPWCRRGTRPGPRSAGWRASSTSSSPPDTPLASSTSSRMHSIASPVPYLSSRTSTSSSPPDPAPGPRRGQDDAVAGRGRRGRGPCGSHRTGAS